MIPHSHRIPLAQSFRFIHEPVSPGDSVAGPTFFVGRERDLDDLCTRLLFSEGGAFLVTGYRGVGKTSFVNTVVNQLAAQLSRSEHLLGPTVLIDVQINLARSVTTTELMHYIIRSLRQRLQESGVLSKLDEGLATDLELAYQRTSFAVAHKSASTSERSMATDFKLQIPALSVGPSFGLGAKRTNQLMRDLSYLAYDEKTAEYDLVRLSRRLRSGYASSRSWPWMGRNRKRTRLKVLFVFDELDKLDDGVPTGQASALDAIFSALKNLFTASGIGFVFIAGKDLQERWLEDVGRGDSIYESVFTYVKYLPTLDCGDQICDAFLDPRSSAEGGESADAYQLFRKYLAFRGRGIPRRILRGFNEYVRWDDGHAALSFAGEDVRRFRFFADLLDHLRGSEKDLVDPAEEEPSSEQGDQRRLGLYYLTDWVLRKGAREFSLEEAILASQHLNRLIAPSEKVAPGLVARLLSVLVAGDYLEEISRPLAQLEVGAAVPQAVKRFRLAPRRHVEMGRRSSQFDQEAAVVLAQVEDRPRPPERYHIVREVGRGAMSVVYEATDIRTGRRVAVKVPDRALMVDPGLARRFQREAEILLKLQHPSIVRVLDYFGSGSGAYMAMEYLDGALLGRILQQQELLGLEACVAIARDLAGAIEHIHSQGVIWRDAKPANVMITLEGRVVIMDFGISRESPDSNQLTSAGMIVGTPDYMSPEQAMGHPLDARSDIFSLGIVLYEIITGQRPFQGKTLHTVLYSLISSDPTPPSALRAIPAELEQLVLRCLAKDPTGRFQSAREILEALPPRSSVDLGALVRSSLEHLTSQGRSRDMETSELPSLRESHAPPATGALARVEPWSGLRDPRLPVLIVGIPQATMVKSIPLTAERYRIGRSPECDIVLDDDSVSRFHADVVRSDQGYALSDLNTANGVILNGTRVKEAKLADGDIIGVGRCELSYLEPLSVENKERPTEDRHLPHLASPNPATLPVAAPPPPPPD